MRKNSKIKICYLSYRKVPCTVVKNFSKAVFDAGYDVSVIMLCNDGEPEFEIDNGRKIFRISLLENYSRNSRRNKLNFIIKVILILNRNRYSIVQITSTCPYFILVKLFTIFYAKSIFQILSYPIAAVFFNSIKRMLITALQCYFMDKIVVQSEELKMNWIGLRKLHKAVVIPVGFNKHDFYPIEPIQRLRIRTALGLRDDQPVLVYSGAISHHRNIDKLIVAFQKVANIRENVKLLMIGGGVALTDIKMLTRTLDLEGSVIFTGRVPYTEVRNLTAMADIGISYIPINHNYTYNPPLKTFEYMACGLPTIATKTQSNSKIIKEGYSGILVNDAPDDVADAIIRLVDDKDLQNHLSRHARSSIMKYDFNYITKNNFLPLYNELLNKV